MSASAEPDVALPTAPSADAPKKTYDASCHCGAFRYSVAISPPLDDPNAAVMECNCSICVCNGYLFVYIPNELVIFTEGNIEQFKSYSFGYKRVNHYFCGTCGASCMVRSKDSDFLPGVTCVNVRMLQGVKLEDLKRKPGNGKNY